MNSAKKNVYLRALGLGAMSGMRSMAGPLAMSYRASREPKGFKGTWVGWLSYPLTVRLFSLMEVGEIIADKTPFLPSRIAPAPLLGRVSLSAFAGAAAFAEADKPALVGGFVSVLG